MGIIDNIYAAGDDAFTSEFEVIFGTLILPIPGITNLTIRTTTLVIPEKSIGTYSYKYRSETVVKNSGEITTPKEFTIEFRVDKYYILYKALSQWMGFLVDPDSGLPKYETLSSGVSPISIPMTIISGYMDRDIPNLFRPTTQIWEFTGCRPTKIGDISLDNGSVDGLKCSVTFTYYKLL